MTAGRIRSIRFLAIVVLAFVVLGHGSSSPVRTPTEVASANTTRQVPEPVPTTSPIATTPEPGVGGAESTPTLSISSITPWVAADGEFQIRFAPTSGIPADAKLTYTIHQSLVASSRTSLRGKVLDIINGGPTGKILQAPVTRSIADYGDPAAGVALSIPVRSSSSSDSARVFLPNPGIHPVELVLTTADGPELWSQVVFLNRLPREPQKGTSEGDSESGSASDRSTRPVTVSMILAIQSDPVFTSDLVPQFSLDSRFLLDSTTELLDKVPSAPLRLGLRPDTFAGLTRTDESWAQNLVAAIARSTGAEVPSTTTDTTVPTTSAPQEASGGASILTLPFVGLDIGSLASPGVGSDAGAVLQNQLSLGSKVVSEVSEGVSSTTWTLDPTVTNDSLPLIKALNFTDVVVPESRIETGDDLDDEQLVTGPVRLEGSSGLRAIAYDDELSQQISDPSRDPSVRAHDVVALLMSNWFTANLGRSEHRAPASVFIVPPTTDAEVITALSAALSGDGPLQSSTGSSLLPAAPDGVDEPTARLAFRSTGSASELIDQSNQSRVQIDAVDAMSRSAEPAIETWRFLNAETFAIGMSSADRRSRHNTIRDQVELKLGAIETPPTRRVVLAARQASIPLRFRNHLPYEVHLKMQARSPRLDVRSTDEGLIVLQPGENQIDLPVDVRAPGQSLLRVQLSTPDDAMPLASFEIPVNSTSISGVGSALSIVSIAFLLLWWLHTLRKRRRETGRAESQHPTVAGEPPEGTGTVDRSG